MSDTECNFDLAQSKTLLSTLQFYLLMVFGHFLLA